MAVVTMGSLPVAELTPAKTELQCCYSDVTGNSGWLRLRKNPNDLADNHLPERASEAAKIGLTLALRYPVTIVPILNQLFVGGVVCCREGAPFSVLNTTGTNCYSPSLFFRKSTQDLKLHGQDTLLDVFANHFKQLLTMMEDSQSFRAWACENDDDYNTVFKAVVTESPGWIDSMQMIPDYEIRQAELRYLFAWLRAGNSPLR